MDPSANAGPPEKRLLIVDGHAYAYRAFYAIRQLSSPTGQPTNAIYGFIRMLTKMVATVKPSHVIIVWDGGLAEERMVLWPDYKKTRAEMPESLTPQLDEIAAYLKAASITSFCQTGVEADDWIAALCRQVSRAGAGVVIASADKDFMQLVDDKVGLLNPGDKPEKIWTATDVRNKLGVDPAQVVDYLSLIGDHVDNIPGVAGVGPKTAADLLGQFGTIDNLLARLDEVKSERIRQSLRQSQEAVRRNQSLIRLRDDLPCDFSWPVLSVQKGDYETLRRLFSGWGFSTLLQELEKAQGGSRDLFSA